MLNGFTEKEIEIAKSVKLNRIKNKLNNGGKCNGTVF